MTLSMANTVSGITRRSTNEQIPHDFDALFRAHRQRLVDTLTVVAGDRERAADAVQDAFVKAHLRWHKISRYDDPIGWVRRVAINRLKDGHRSERRKRRAVDRLAGEREQFADPPATAELTESLALLPRQQRLCLALFYVADLAIADIADDLSISEGSVKSHLHDGRRALRRQTATHDEEPNR